MGRLLVNGAGGSVRRHLVNPPAAHDHQRRGGDIRHPVHERSPAHLMSPAAPGRMSGNFLVRHGFGSEPHSAGAGGMAPAYTRIGRPAGAGAYEAARSAAKQPLPKSSTAG